VILVARELIRRARHGYCLLGHVLGRVGRAEWQDHQEVLRYLRRLKAPTFFTRDAASLCQWSPPLRVMADRGLLKAGGSALKGASFGEDESTERERRHFQARQVGVFACVLDFDSDDVLVCIEVKHDSRATSSDLRRLRRRILHFPGLTRSSARWRANCVNVLAHRSALAGFSAVHHWRVLGVHRGGWDLAPRLDGGLTALRQVARQHSPRGRQT